MEIKVVEEDKNRIKFEISGEGHSFCSALKSELWNDKSIDVAAYFIKHQLDPRPIFVVETSKGDPKKAVLGAVERLQRRNKEMAEKFKKL